MADAPDTPGSAQPGQVDDLQRRNAELEVLFDTVKDLISTLSTHEVIERLVDRTLVHLDSEIASVLFLEPDSTMRIIHARGLPDSVVAETRVRVGEGIAGHVAAAGAPLLVPDVEVDPRFRRRNHERYYTHSCVSAPLIFQGKVRGVINVNNKHDQSAYTVADLRLLEAAKRQGHGASAGAGDVRHQGLVQRHPGGAAQPAFERPSRGRGKGAACRRRPGERGQHQHDAPPQPRQAVSGEEPPSPGERGDDEKRRRGAE